MQRFVATYSRPSLTWDDLSFLRERTRLPILLKGILHPDDARRAVERDVFKALALGARAVCLGRPYVYGLALAGEEGVREVIRNVLADFDLTLGLAGCRSASEVTSESLTRIG